MKFKRGKIMVAACCIAAFLVGALKAEAVNLENPSTALGLFTVLGELRKDEANTRFRVSGGRVIIVNTSNNDYFSFSTGGFQFDRALATYMDSMSPTGSIRFRLSTTQNARNVMALILENSGDVLVPTGDLLVQNGSITAKNEISAAVVEIRGEGNDLAEGFKIHAEEGVAQPGMVVAIDPTNPGELVLSSKAYDRTVVGIISGAGDKRVGLQLGHSDEVAQGLLTPVALTGRVWCHVDGNYGAVTPGDFLTTSPTLGHAMVAADFDQGRGAIIGKAMTPLALGEQGLVLVLVNLQ